MTLNEILTLAAIFLSPIAAVGITLWYNYQKDKKQQKTDLFLTLLATRKTYPTPPKFVDGLNTIDVVFHGDKDVISAWKELFSSYHTEPFQIQIADRKLLDLLDAMAKSLGYKNIKQTDFDSFYEPRLFGNQRTFQETVNQELLRVLKNSESFGNPTQSNQNTET